MYKSFIKQNYKFLINIFNCMNVGVWITDEEGVLIMVNDTSLKGGGLAREEVMGKSMHELLESGYIIDESSVLNAISSGKTESIVQELGEGGYVVCTSTPLYVGNHIDIVICIERNITEVVNLKELLRNQTAIAEGFKSQLMQFQNQHKIEQEDMIAINIGMVRLKEMAIRMAQKDATVIITGESGTGKEVFADLIHRNSMRKDKPFIKINCAAIPENLIESEFFGYEPGTFTGANQGGKVGIFELADKGTLFLDEIGELPLSIQSKLLRALNDKQIRRIGGETTIPIDVRIIAATNRNLKNEIKEGNFRKDLYYRLFVIPIEIPPLRERVEDIEPLANHFIEHYNEKYMTDKVLEREAIEEMYKYDWPGNIRELKNVIERLVVSGAGDRISKFQMHMCLYGNESIGLYGTNIMDMNQTLDEMVKEFEKQIIKKALTECDNATEAARLLGVDKSTISRKRKIHNI